jgi:hypothetical protein
VTQEECRKDCTDVLRGEDLSAITVNVVCWEGKLYEVEKVRERESAG